MKKLTQPNFILKAFSAATLVSLSMGVSADTFLCQQGTFCTDNNGGNQVVPSGPRTVTLNGNIRHFVAGWPNVSYTVGQGTGSKAGANATVAKTTPANDAGGFYSIFLDRHHLDCGSKGITQFNLFRPSEHEIAYSYQCRNVAEQARYGQSIWEYPSRRTNPNDDGGGNTAFLDRHAIDCGHNPIHSFKLERPSASTIAYRYWCGTNPLPDITVHQTAPTEMHGHSIYLDRQNVQCPSGKVLTYVKLQNVSTHVGGLLWNYKFKCGQPYQNTIDVSASNRPATVYGSHLRDVIIGTNQADILYGNQGSDTIYAKDGDDVLVGGHGNDILFGDNGGDRIYGQTGNDVLVGGAHNDHILGGSGNDQIHGQGGSDTLTGNAGKDHFYSEDNDTITDLKYQDDSLN